VRRIAIALAAAVAVLAGAGAAQAKELTALQTCGAGGCTAVRGALLHRLIRLAEGARNPVAAPVPALAPYIRVEFTFRGDGGHGPSFSQYYVPKAHLAAVETGPGQASWVRPEPEQQRLYEQLAARVKPFAPPRFVGATVNGKPVAGGASYARLLTIRGERLLGVDAPDWAPIALRSAAPSPWTTAATTLEYSAQENVLWRGDEFVRLPGALASDVEHLRALHEPQSAGFPWLALPAALVVAALAAVGLLVVRRRPRAG
jgi:hypothetical protein